MMARYYEPCCDELGCANDARVCPHAGCTNYSRWCDEHADPEADYCDACAAGRFRCTECGRWQFETEKRPKHVVQDPYKHASIPPTPDWVYCHSCFRKLKPPVVPPWPSRSALAPPAVMFSADGCPLFAFSASSAKK